MADLIIKSITKKPIRITLSLNGQEYTLEYPDKQAAIDALTNNIPDHELQPELALLLVLREWKKTDPNLTKLADLIDKTCTISTGVKIT